MIDNEFLVSIERKVYSITRAFWGCLIIISIRLMIGFSHPKLVIDPLIIDKVINLLALPDDIKRMPKVRD